MKTINIKSVFFSLIILSTLEAFAQEANLTGDTIYANSSAEVLIKFPSDNIDLRWADLAPAFTTSHAPNSILLHAKSDEAKCSRLSVFEGPGPRNHNFFVCFKKDISKDIYDFSTVKKLQQRAKEIAVRGVAKAESAEVSAKTSAGQKPSKNESDTKAYNALIEQGDVALKNGELDDAQNKYQEVLNMQADNSAAKKGLATVKEKKAEKEQLAKKELNNKINTIKADAAKALAAKNYDAAMKGYIEALSLNPNDAFSKNQLSVIQKSKDENELKEKQEKEQLAKKEFNDIKDGLNLKAAKALSEKQYDDAIAAYQELLVLVPDDELSKTRIASIKNIKLQIEQKEKQVAQNKDIEATYNNTVAAADKAFNNKEYEVAKAGYLAAKEMKPNDAAIDNKIKAVNSKIQESLGDEAYKNAIAAGNEAKNAGDYVKAKAEFTRAVSLSKNSAYAEQQISEINKTLASLSAQQNAAKEKQAKELIQNTKYQSAVEKGDKALTKNDFTNARLAYNEAASIKPDETYPKDKLTEIKDIQTALEKDKKEKADNLAKETETNRKYTLALQKAKAAFEKNDFSSATEFYNQAAALKPGESEPKNQLTLLEKKKNQEGVDEKFNDVYGKGNIATSEKRYAEALEFYRQAVKIKPLASNALSQINFVQSEMTKDSMQQAFAARQAIVRLQEEVRRKRFDEGMSAYAQYEIAAQVSNYEDQLKHLKHFLNIIPDATELNTYQYNAGAKIDFSKKKIKTIRDYLTRIKGAAYQLEPIPYLEKELEAKYENINFSSPPDEQIFDKMENSAAESVAKASQELLSETPKLKLADSANNVTIICEAIDIKGDKTFYKFKIQNKSADEFLTGVMQLSHVKKGGSITRVNPDYVSSFPIILPGKEFSLIYHTKDVVVAPKETLFFELHDRFGKNKLKLYIPGEIYAEQKTRKL